MEIELPAITGSDHSPLLLTMDEGMNSYRKPLRFLMFWTDHDQYIKGEFVYFVFKENIKRATSSFTKWSKEVYGDIF